MKIPFVKMSGAGNDFIVIDNRTGLLAESGREARFARWCRRRTDVGADGVLLVEPDSDGLDFRMRYYNADGGEVESCGNGARCIARFAHMIGAAPAQMRFATQAGPYEATVGKDDVTIGLSDPKDLRRNLAVTIPGLFEGTVDFINTGVPHVVLNFPDLEATPVIDLGRALRRHELFAPAGTNVNFIALTDDGCFGVRTYERGVEDETLACGTGAVAAALIANLHGLTESPVSLRTRGGSILRIHFEAGENGFHGIRLQGEARVVYRGELEES